MKKQHLKKINIQVIKVLSGIREKLKTLHLIYDFNSTYQQTKYIYQPLTHNFSYTF